MNVQATYHKRMITRLLAEPDSCILILEGRLLSAGHTGTGYRARSLRSPVGMRRIDPGQMKSLLIHRMSANRKFTPYQRSFKISRAALCPAAPITPPPG